MSTLPADRVFTGFWIDYSRGPVLGSTITVRSDTANTIVAILSVIITFAGSHLWDIIAYCWFASKATRKACDGLHHQCQILLRNIASPAAITLKAVKMYWQWRRSNIKQRRRISLAPLAIVASGCSAGFLVAGVLSSQIVFGTDIEVVARSEYCGFEKRSGEGARIAVLSAQHYVASLRENVAYTENCYGGSASNPACQIYTTQTIPFDVSHEACLFDRICTLEHASTISMDTGLMWSDKIFGINFPPSSALALRKVTKCAPINVSQYEETSPMDKSSASIYYHRLPLSDEYVTKWYIGPWTSSSEQETLVSTSITTNTSQTYLTGSASRQAKVVKPFKQTPWLHDLGFEPIPPLSSAPGDLTIVSISSAQIIYTAEVDDPVFAAHTPCVIDPSVREPVDLMTLYSADDLARMIGCTEQYQYCTAAGSCTDLTDSFEASEQASDLGLNAMQNLTLYAFANALINFSSGLNSLWSLGPDFPLLARSGLASGIRNKLPQNHWESEVRYWNAISLVGIQKYVTEVASGQGFPNPAFNALLKEPPGPVESLLCHAQKMKAPNGFSNISVFGLSFTLAVSGFIIVINFILARTLRWVSHYRTKPWHFVRQWDIEEILHLQKTAYESNGIGVWSQDIRRTPFTMTAERFESLDSEVLLKPSSTSAASTLAPTILSSSTTPSATPSVTIPTASPNKPAPQTTQNTVTPTTISSTTHSTGTAVQIVNASANANASAINTNNTPATHTTGNKP